MGRSRRAGRLVQLRRLARAYATPGVFDPRVFDSPARPIQPSLPPPPPHPYPLVGISPPQPPTGATNRVPPSPPPSPSYPRAPDPCPVRAWAPRPPVTLAPRAPTAALQVAPLPRPTERGKRAPPGPSPAKPQAPLKRVKPRVIRIEALPQKIRLVRRPRGQLRDVKDMPALL
ncbi:PREDICTED: vegetative cell wall protein gp1-like [Vollenhovia emeryi]|uniref:vegetative cell wall protein gp1-like n=1 Tax=Vollenhovia emeryi TaxID=411798 RepID=UPI0005F4FD2F|nr:PREDICTED: vegetative cell wall protein gp1-like [Vollenhovia emeryi]